MTSDFGNLDETLKKYLQKKGMTARAIAGQILYDYENILAKKIHIKDSYKAKKLQDKILYVSVADSALAQKITFLNPDILIELQKKHPQKITKINVRVENMSSDMLS